MKIDTKTNYIKNMNNDFIDAVKLVNEKMIPQTFTSKNNGNKICEIKRNGNLFFANCNGLEISFVVNER